MTEEMFQAILQFLIHAFQGGDWCTVGAILVMFSVWICSKWVKNTTVLPFLSAGFGMLYSLVVFMIGNQDANWYYILYRGLIASGEASLFWSLVGKRLQSKSKR